LSPAAENASFLGDDSVSPHTFSFACAIRIWMRKRRQQRENDCAHFDSTTVATTSRTNATAPDSAPRTAASFSAFDHNESCQ
jgi:hypothetical protein